MSTEALATVIAAVIAALATIGAAFVAAWASGSVMRKNLERDQKIYDWCKANNKNDQRALMGAVIDDSIATLHGSWRARSSYVCSILLGLEGVGFLVLAFTPIFNDVSRIILVVTSVVTLVCCVAAFIQARNIVNEQRSGKGKGSGKGAAKEPAAKNERESSAVEASSSALAAAAGVSASAEASFSSTMSRMWGLPEDVLADEQKRKMAELLQAVEDSDKDEGELRCAGKALMDWSLDNATKAVPSVMPYFTQEVQRLFD